MIGELIVKNFAIIDELRSEFSPGFNIITGETGAGKTIFLEAVSILSGAKTDPGQIRHGCDFSAVEARFEDDGDHPNQLFEEGSLIVSRKIFPDKGSRCWINGSPGTIKSLSEIVRELFHYQGQHESQRLFDPAEQLKIIDSFAPEQFEHLLESYRHSYSRLMQIRSELQILESDEKSRTRELERLKFEINEIDKANLQTGELEKLEQDILICRNAARLSGAISYAVEALADGADGANARDLIFSALKEFSPVSGLVPELDRNIAALESIGHGLGEAVADLKRYRDSIDFDPARLEALEDRLALIKTLIKKYGDSIEEIIDYCESAKERVSALEGSGLSMSELEEEREALTGELKEMAAELSAIRRETAKRVVKELKKELADLGIDKCSLEVSFAALDFGPDGRDQIEILISTNPGEPVRELRKIASGGELSRFMLALQSIIPFKERRLTLFFDEVDSGIGGATAVMVGEKLRKLSQKTQVICITHLPQIAAKADRHFHISKEVSGGRTRARISQLNDDERTAEIARMISGQKQSQISLSQAREFLQKSDRLETE